MISSWTDASMDWSSWGVIKPWKREYAEAIRAALYERCVKARQLNDIYVSGVPKQTWTPKIAWAYLDAIKIPIHDNHGILAFASWAATIESTIAAICQYFANPAYAIQPIDGLSEWEEVGGETGEAMREHDVQPWSSSPMEWRDGMNYRAPTPGYFPNYTWQSLRAATAALDVDLVGAVPENALMDSEHVRKWFLMVKTMLGLLKYLPFRQCVRRSVGVDWRYSVAESTVNSGSGGKIVLRQHSPSGDIAIDDWTHRYQTSQGYDDGENVAGRVWPPTDSMADILAWEGSGTVGIKESVNYARFYEYSKWHEYTHAHAYQGTATTTFTVSVTLSADSGINDYPEGTLEPLGPEVLVAPSIVVKGSVTTTEPVANEVIVDIPEELGGPYTYMDYTFETTVTEYEKATTVLPSENDDVNIAYGADESKITHLEIADVFPAENAEKWVHFSSTDVYGWGRSFVQTEWYEWVEGTAPHVRWPAARLTMDAMPATPSEYDLNFI